MHFPKKETIILSLDRRKSPLDKNLRLISFLLVITLLIGLFLPFAGVRAGVSVVDENTGNAVLNLLDSGTDVTSFSMTDLMSQKQIGEYPVFGKRLRDYRLFGISIYDTLMTPLPEPTVLNNIKSSINGEWVELLTDEELVRFCVENLGDFGKGLVDVAHFLSDAIMISREAVDAADTLYRGMGDVSTAIRATNDSVQGALSAGGYVLWGLVILIAAVIVLYFIGKGPRFLSGILLASISGLFLLTGIAVLIVNGYLAGLIEASVSSVNTAIGDFLQTNIPLLSGLMKLLAGGIEPNFSAFLKVLCGPGYWMITLSLIGLTAFAFVIPPLRGRRMKREAEALAAQEDAEEKKADETV